MEEVKVDCMTCYKKDDCPIAKEAQFCPAWRSSPPPDRQPDPNDLWRKGEEAPFL